MRTLLSAQFLFLICIIASVMQPVAASQGTTYQLTVGISEIEPKSDMPYVDVQYLHFRAEIYNETAFPWFWVPSADLLGYRDSSHNFTVTFENGRVDRFQVANISLAWEEPQRKRWRLNPVNDFMYAFGIIVAFPINVTFPMVFTSATLMTRELEDQWSASTGWERYGSPPSNTTLSMWGINPDRFWRTPWVSDSKTFYLYEVYLSRLGSFQARVDLTYRGPAILLLMVLIASIMPPVRRRLHVRDFLTLYMGTAFFCMPFLVSYSQLGLGPLSLTENLFYIDIYLSAILALISLITIGWRGKKPDTHA